MKWIGLTGGIASGKSTASQIIRGLGITVIDADHIAHEVVSIGSVGLERVRLAFGPGVLNSDGSLNRKELGNKIFSDKNSRDLLESILHPLIQAEVQKQKSQSEKNGEEIVFYDVPLLFEKNLQSQFDDTVLITCSEKTQIERMRSRNGYAEDEALARLSSQLPLSEKEKMATVIIQNEGTFDDLKNEIEKYILTKTRKSH